MKWEDYKNKRSTEILHLHNMNYLKTDIECPVCGAPVYKNTSIVLTSYPPQYQFHCEKCGWYGTSY